MNGQVTVFFCKKKIGLDFGGMDADVLDPL